MTGGIIQLVALGHENVFITNKPQITYFKVVYKRHTNFSMEEIPQYFTNKLSWGKTSTCTISKEGDLMSNVSLVVELPRVNSFMTQTGEDTLTKFAWVKRIGYVLIKNIAIEINGRVIDRHYGEWLNLWTEMFGKNDNGIDKLIGDVEELTTFTNGKDSYRLYIPLKFWFCKSPSLAIPLVSLKYSDVKIKLELNDFNKCHIISPTHYINCEADLVNFKPFEYIEQNVDGIIYAGIFSHYDIINRRLYYTKITKEKFIGIESTITNPTAIEKNNIINNEENQKYRIYGMSSDFYVIPSINTKSKNHSYVKLINVNIDDAYLLVNYIFLDEDERFKIAQAKNDYLIEQLFFTPDIPLESSNRSIKVSVSNPCKMMVWIVQLDYIKKSLDHFNYTNSHIRKLYDDEYNDVEIGQVTGNSLITEQTILFNGNERLKIRDGDYFYNVQNYQHCKKSPPKGTNSYFYSINASDIQPAGTCNMSQFNSVDIKLRMSHIVNPNNIARGRCYSLVNNIFRVSHGLGGLVFDNKT